jgi:uncharacterized protein YbjT (DUF2867 family)
MKILVLGATGRTGKLIVEEAIKKGHQVVAIARDPAKLASSGAEVMRGTPYDRETVEKAMPGCDAVINTLNVSRTSDNPWASLRAPKDLISKSAENALSAMKQHDVDRIVVLSTVGAGSSKASAPAVLRFIVALSNLRYAFDDHTRQENLIINSHTDYTIARAPMLSDRENESGVKVIKEGSGGRLKRTISRRSVARFFVEIIENKKYLREVVGICDNA